MIILVTDTGSYDLINIFPVVINCNWEWKQPMKSTVGLCGFKSLPPNDPRIPWLSGEGKLKCACIGDNVLNP